MYRYNTHKQRQVWPGGTIVIVHARGPRVCWVQTVVVVVAVVVIAVAVACRLSTREHTHTHTHPKPGHKGFHSILDLCATSAKHG